MEIPSAFFLSFKNICCFFATILQAIHRIAWTWLKMPFTDTTAYTKHIEEQKLSFNHWLLKEWLHPHSWICRCVWEEQTTRCIERESHCIPFLWTFNPDPPQLWECHKPPRRKHYRLFRRKHLKFDKRWKPSRYHKNCFGILWPHHNETPAWRSCPLCKWNIWCADY